MIFSLEALRAAHGDSLILHFGDPAKPQFIVIDGGPSGVYKDAFRPRLDALAERWAVDGKLPIEVLLISHLDDDHIRGVLDLTNKLIESKNVAAPPFDVRTLWHNAFDDLVGKGAAELASTLAEAPGRIAAAEGEAPPWNGESDAVVASVGQGRKLRVNAEGLGWEPNAQFGGKLIVAGGGGVEQVQIGPLTLTVVAPLREELLKLQAEWDSELQRHKLAKDAKEAAKVAAYVDDSVYNLSSIVLLAELGGKRMLLTGDARGDLVLRGLERAGLLSADEPLVVDVLKLPHHGSDRNVEDGFFERIHATHYVVSGDGKHDNPSPATFTMIERARPDGGYTVHLTYKEFRGKINAELGPLIAAHEGEPGDGEPTYAARPQDSLSVIVDLLDDVTY